jgi:hypothetical protein
VSGEYDPAGRPLPPDAGDERATLVGYLDYQRATLAWKTAGLTPEQLATRSVPTSTMSLLGLVRHAADVEGGWGHSVLGDHGKRYYSTRQRPDADFEDAVGKQSVVEQAHADWATAKSEFDAAIAARDLGDLFSNRHGETFSIRNLLCHMIEEYARHNGHADLLREAIDGATGE